MNGKNKTWIAILGILSVVLVLVAIHFFQERTEHTTGKSGTAQQLGLDAPVSANQSGVPSELPSNGPRKFHVQSQASSANPQAAAGAAEEFKAARSCFGASLSLDVAVHAMTVCKDPNRANDQELQAQCQRFHAMFPSGNPSLADLTQRGCGQSQNEIAKNYYDSMYRAAVGGDQDAAFCFIDRDRQAFSTAENGLGPADFAALQEQSRAWAGQYFEQGDWHIVNYVVSNLESHTPSGYLVSAIPGLASTENDAMFTEYALLKLLRLGATGAYATDLDQQLVLRTVNNPNIPPENLARAGVLNAADQGAADAWAKSAYDKYFAKSPALSGAPTFCDHPELNAMLAY